ncbi:MAG: carotenoid biosynthesis protein [Methylacidiphilales bacterium]|nr:carotenoid biosynthesis protein [Candidatus Methylacidiphilales bacterium]
MRSKTGAWNFAEKISLVAFVIWSALGLLFTVERISPDAIAHWPVPDWLGHFVDLCLENGDPILILLAFANTHLHAVRQWSAGVARRWGLIILVCSFVIETFGVSIGFPFGDYQYTDHFGPMLGVVPLIIPLAWHVVVTNALFIVRAVAPHASRLGEAALAGLLCTLYDFILEPFATVAKHYWTWTGGTIPLINYVAWFVLSGLLVRIFAPTLSSRYRLDPRPALILGLTILIFISAEF